MTISAWSIGRRALVVVGGAYVAAVAGVGLTAAAGLPPMVQMLAGCVAFATLALAGGSRLLGVRWLMARRRGAGMVANWMSIFGAVLLTDAVVSRFGDRGPLAAVVTVLPAFLVAQYLIDRWGLDQVAPRPR